MIDVNRKGEVWVFAEQTEGKLSDVPLELLGRGRTLADKLGVKLAAVLLGHGTAELSKQLGAYGADRVYLAEDALLQDYQTIPYAKAICRLIEKHKPQIVLYGATPIGRDLAPRVASAMKAGLTADCTDLQIGDYEVKRPQRSSQESALADSSRVRRQTSSPPSSTRTAGRRWPPSAKASCPCPRTTVPPPRSSPNRLELASTDAAVKVIQRHHRAKKKVDLKASRIIVAGGAGVGSADNFQQIWDLANVLGGAPAASRAAVDLGV